MNSSPAATKTAILRTGTTIAATGTSPGSAFSVVSVWKTLECVNKVETDDVENTDDDVSF